MLRRVLPVFTIVFAVASGLVVAASVVGPFASSSSDPPPILRSIVEALSVPPTNPAPDSVEYLVAPPLDLPHGPTMPWRVGVQAGHLRADELPQELAHLREDVGAAAAGYREADVNLGIANAVAEDLRAAGVTVDVLPATVPPGYRADAFIAIHADGAASPLQRGWKAATPWASSQASRLLESTIASVYGGQTGLPEDTYGVSYFMRGYYAFNWRRYRHAIAPTTPAVIIETGFLTSPSDRTVIVGDPRRVAQAVSTGVLSFLAASAALPSQAFVPRSYPPVTVARDATPLRLAPDTGAPPAARLPAGTVLRVFDEEDGWDDVMVWGTTGPSAGSGSPMWLSDLRQRGPRGEQSRQVSADDVGAAAHADSREFP